MVLTYIEGQQSFRCFDQRQAGIFTQVKHYLRISSCCFTKLCHNTTQHIPKFTFLQTCKLWTQEVRKLDTFTKFHFFVGLVMKQCVQNWSSNCMLLSSWRIRFKGGFFLAMLIHGKKTSDVAGMAFLAKKKLAENLA